MNYGQKLYWKHLIHVWEVIIIVLLIVAGFFWHEKSTFDQSQAMKQNYQTAVMRANSHKDNVQDDVIKDSANSHNSTLRAIGSNNKIMKTTVAPVKQFLNGYYNWSGQDGFNARKWKVQKVVTSNVVRDGSLFNKPHKYDNFDQMNSVLNDLNVSVQAWNGNNVTLLTNAYYTAWNNQDDQGDTNDYAQNGGTSNDKQRNNGSQWMKIIVNLKTHKITNVKLIYLNPKAHESTSNSNNSSGKTGAGVSY